MIELVVVVVVANGALGVVVEDRLTCFPSFMVYLVCWSVFGMACRLYCITVFL